MNEHDQAAISRLSRIETLWSVVRRSQEADNELALSAQQQLLDLYGNAIKRYLVGALRNESQADDLFQEFALKFVQRDFQGADPTKGRFRAYVKTVLYRMVALHHRKNKSSKEQGLSHDSVVEPESVENSLDDQEFFHGWRAELLDQAWEALEDHQTRSGVPYFTVLSVRVNEPSLSSQELAERLSVELGKPIKSGTARVTLHRARDKFASFIIDAVAQSLEQPTRANIEGELIELALIEYCRDALDSVNAEWGNTTFPK